MNGFDCPVRPTSSSNLFQILSVTNTVAATLKVNLSLVMSTKTVPAISRIDALRRKFVLPRVLCEPERLPCGVDECQTARVLQLFKAELLIDDDIYRHFTASFTAGTVATTVWSPTDIKATS
ncbi:hypothetical protein B0H14DRAFT_3456468 [Mycena olivaceomarginata]|nr:hypothetical protein B0H14DRAFT_3456468 [Mycena olivaceomarginata]